MKKKKKKKREDYLHYVDWSEGGNSPKTLTIDDYEKLKASDKLMARKFDIGTDINILNHLPIKMGSKECQSMKKI